VKRSLTAQCLIGLLLGLAIGILLTRVAPEAVPAGLSIADGAIRIWTNALRLLVAPLVVSQLFVAITAHQASKGEAARLGVSIPAVFLFLLVFVAVSTVLLTLGITSLPFLQGLAFPTLGAAVSPTGTTPTPVPGTGSWIDDLVPSNLVIAASRPEAILGLILFAIVFARAARRLADPLEQSLKTLALAVRDTLFILIGWLLLVVPILLLALGFRSAVNTGLDVGKLLVVYIVIESVVCVVNTGLLYPVAGLIGGVSPARFARAVFPAQVAAATSRSSLATVPLLLKEAESGLGLPTRISGLVIPLGAATLKLSRMVSSPVKFIFLTHFLGIPISIEQILVFTITIIMLSPLTVGMPSVISGSRSLPAFVAAGIPPEYVVLLAATTWIVDVFLTIINSTGYMTAAVIVSRLFTTRSASGQALVPGDDSSASV
jgi:Na+/H+-dicarboxylate symporter